MAHVQWLHYVQFGREDAWRVYGMSWYAASCPVIEQYADTLSYFVAQHLHL